MQRSFSDYIIIPEYIIIFNTYVGTQQKSTMESPSRCGGKKNTHFVAEQIYYKYDQNFQGLYDVY